MTIFRGKYIKVRPSRVKDYARENGFSPLKEAKQEKTDKDYRQIAQDLSDFFDDCLTYNGRIETTRYYDD